MKKKLSTFVLFLILQVASWSQNLVQNGDFETGTLENWEIVQGSTSIWSNGDNGIKCHGQYFYRAGDAGPIIIEQAIDLSDHITQIDSAEAQAELGGWLTTWDVVPHDIQLVAYFLDAGQATIGDPLVVSSLGNPIPRSDNLGLTDPATYEVGEAPIPVGSRSVLLQIILRETINHALADDIELIVKDRDQRISASLSKDSVLEGENFVVYLEREVEEGEAIITLDLPRDRFSYPEEILFADGSITSEVMISVVDNGAIERNTNSTFQAFSEGHQDSNQVSLTVLDDDWSGFDENQNQMSDIWERVHEVYGADPDADPDGDGLSNFVEDKWGTNPLAGDSRPHFRAVAENSTETETCMEFHLPQGKRFQIQATSDLKTWENIGEIIVSEGELEEVMIEQDGTHEFYRLLGLESIDTDGDGLNDDDEALLGTDPRHRDTDRDGLEDGFEMQRYVSMANYGAPSGGTAPGTQEQEAEKNPTIEGPTNPDEDGNGVPDGSDVVLYVASASAKNRKQGYPAYESRTNNIQGPPPGLDYIPIFHKETRTWSYSGWELNIDGNSECVHRKGEPNWGSGSIEWTMDAERREAPVSDSGAPPNNWTKWWQAESSSPHGQALRKQYGSLQPFEFGAATGSPATQGFSATFEQSEYGGFCADAPGGNLWATGWAAVTGNLSNEFTTEDNIAFTIEKARGQMGRMMPSSAAAGEISIPGTMTGFGNGGAWERIADVTASNYTVVSSASELPNIAVISRSDDGSVSVLSGNGQLPQANEGELTQSTFFVHPYFPQGFGPEWVNYILLGEDGDYSFTLSTAGGDAIEPDLLNEFSVSNGGQYVWNSTSNKILITGNSDGGMISLSIGGVVLWSGTFIKEEEVCASLINDIPWTPVRELTVNASGLVEFIKNFTKIVPGHQEAGVDGIITYKIQEKEGCCGITDTQMVTLESHSFGGGINAFAATGELPIPYLSFGISGAFISSSGSISITGNAISSQSCSDKNKDLSFTIPVEGSVSFTGGVAIVRNWLSGGIESNVTIGGGIVLSEGDVNLQGITVSGQVSWVTNSPFASTKHVIKIF